MSKIDNPTHIYKNKPVRFVEFTYEYNGKQYCTIEMINRVGKTQRQTVQYQNLTILGANAGDLDTDDLPFGGWMPNEADLPEI